MRRRPAGRGRPPLRRWLAFGSWPITLHVLVGPAILLVFLLALTLTTLVAFNRLGTTSRLVGESAALLADAEEFAKLVIDMETGVRGFVIAGDERFLDPYTAAQEQARAALATLRSAAAGDPASLDRLIRVGAILDDWEEVVARPMIAGTRAGEDVSPLVRSGAGKRRIDLIRAEMSALLAEVQAAQGTRAEADAAQRRIVEALLLASPAVGLGAFALAYVIGRRVSRPVQALAAAAQRLGAGDLTTRVDVVGTNELASAARTFNRMAQALTAQTEALHLRAAEAEQARSQVRAVLDSTNEVFVHADADGRVQSINRRFETLFGLPSSPLIGRPWTAAVARLEQVVADAPTLLADQETATIAQHWPVARELELTQRPVRDGAGVDLGRLYVFRDVTREREIDRMKSEFVSLVSHELRTPLTSVKGYVRLIADGSAGELTAEQAEFLGVVAEDVDRLVDLVNDLLDVSRIEAGRVEVGGEAVDLSALIADVAVRFRPAVTAKRQALVVTAPDALPRAWASPEAVVRVLTNLLSNAHKYTRAGGTLTVRAAAADDHLRVEVQDSGIGLSADEQARLFSKFFRARNQATEEEGGTGLGLVIARGLVEAQGGQLSVASAPGEGATFAFTLPRADAVGAGGAPAPGSPGHPPAASD